MIATFTDFGVTGPYLGQLRAVIAGRAPNVSVVDVFPDLPAFDIRSSAYLLPAYSNYLPDECICLCVVDPGVGGPRNAIAVQDGGRWYVGPDNGLLSQIVRRAGAPRVFAIDWRPQRLSNSFHGRDLFAPVCAMLATGKGLPEHRELPVDDIDNDWPDELWRVVYIDAYGNCITGVRAAALADDTRLQIRGIELERKRTFSDSRPGTLFWYENSNGLVEVAMADGDAAAQQAIAVGTELIWLAD